MPLRNRNEILLRRGIKRATGEKYAPNSLYIPRGATIDYVDILLSNLASYLAHLGFNKHSTCDRDRIVDVMVFINSALNVTYNLRFYMKACHSSAHMRCIPGVPEVVSIIEHFINLGVNCEIRKLLYGQRELDLMI